MAELTGNSSADDLRQSYWENASFEEDASTTKCRRFITAVRILLATPSKTARGGRGGAEVEFDKAALQTQLRQAQQWLAENDTDNQPPGNTAADFSTFDRRA